MKIRLFVTFLLLSFCTKVQAQLPVKFNLESKSKVEVLIGGKHFTTFYAPSEDILKKAVLYPVKSPDGSVITRGWPLDPLPGERVDHPHHVGVWLNYESVNGSDFWNNSNDVDHKKNKYGTVKTVGDLNLKTYKKGGGELKTTAIWEDSENIKTLKETTTYHFSGDGLRNIVDRITTLEAICDTVLFKDVKDGLFAIRVNRNLELPSTKPDIFTDASGIATAVPKLDNTGVTGNYRNAEGVLDEKTWSLRSPWITLEGQMPNGGKSVTIIDHKKNINYPSYWHSRGYGLFSVNPLGEKIFTNGQKATNLRLKKGEKVTFRYRLIIADKHFKDDEINSLKTDFHKKYK